MLTNSSSARLCSLIISIVHATAMHAEVRVLFVSVLVHVFVKHKTLITEFDLLGIIVDQSNRGTLYAKAMVTEDKSRLPDDIRSPSEAQTSLLFS